MQPVYRRSYGVSILVGVAMLLAGARAFAQSPSGFRPFEVITGTDVDEVRHRWDEIFSGPNYVYGRDPVPLLKEFIGQLPVGRALDIAMGEGRNSVFLAKKGFVVEGVDISEVALRKAQRLARDQKVTIKTINADLRQYTIAPDTYDVIVDVQFMLRALIPQIKRGLKKGGVVVFQAYTTDQLQNPGGATVVKDYLLNKGEAKEMFSDFKILYFKEENDGKNAYAYLVAKKR